MKKIAFISTLVLVLSLLVFIPENYAGPGRVRNAKVLVAEYDSTDIVGGLTDTLLINADSATYAFVIKEATVEFDSGVAYAYSHVDRYLLRTKSGATSYIVAEVDTDDFELAKGFIRNLVLLTAQTSGSVITFRLPSSSCTTGNRHMTLKVYYDMIKREYDQWEQ